MTRAGHHTMATNDDHRKGLKRRGLFFLFICSTKGNHNENDEATATANTSTRNNRWGAQFLFRPSELKSVIASGTLLREARYKEFRHRKERLDAVSR